MRDSGHVVCVVGPPRTGTSLLASSLRVLGLQLGDDLHVGDHHNPLGYFEDRALVDLNYRILALVGLDLHSVTDVPPSAWPTHRLERLRREARRYVSLVVSKGGSWCFKDPRIARLMWFWRDVFASEGVEDSYVVACRHPLAMAKSMARFSGSPLEVAGLLWLRLTIGALSGTDSRRAVVVDYDDLLQSYSDVLGRVALHLGLEVPDEEVLGAARCSLVSDGLRHNVCDPTDLGPLAKIPGVARLHGLCLSLGRGELSLESSEVATRLEEVCAESREAEPFVGALEWLRRRDHLVYKALMGERPDISPEDYPADPGLRTLLDVFQPRPYELISSGGRPDVHS